MRKPRVALFLGILCISLFPVLIRLQLSSGLIAAFYRMAIAALFLLPYAIIKKKFRFSSPQMWLPVVGCGILFACDIAVWNISIQESSATQATLLTNLSPVWVGIISFLFLTNKPRRSFWIGSVIAMTGIVVFMGLSTFKGLSFDRAFIFGLLSGLFYAMYILLSKKVLETEEVISFVTVSTVSSTLFLLLVNLFFNQQFIGYDTSAWLTFWVQGIVCQLMAWLLISYATQRMRATRVSLALLSQVVFAGLLAWLWIGEAVTLQKIAGGVLILLGIAATFYEPATKKIENN